VLVSGLTFGDYVLWNWSLSSNRDVLALVSGLTLPPLAVACVWLLALTVARVVAETSRRRSARRDGVRAAAGRDDRRTGELANRERRPATGTGATGEASTAASAAGAPPGKLAA